MDTLSPSSPPPVRLHFEDVISDFRHWLRRACDECDAAVREHPRESLLAAFALGAITPRLPLPALVATGLRTAIAAAPAALAAIGVGALADYCRHHLSACSPAARPPRSRDTRPDEFPLDGDGHTVFPDSSPLPPSPPAGIVT